MKKNQKIKKQTWTHSSQKMEYKWLININKNLTSLCARKMKVKGTLRFHLILLRMAIINQTKINKFWKGWEAWKTPECSMVFCSDLEQVSPLNPKLLSREQRETTKPSSLSTSVKLSFILECNHFYFMYSKAHFKELVLSSWIFLLWCVQYIL